MNKIFNVNIERQYAIPTPHEIRSELPISPQLAEAVFKSRRTVEDIVARRDKRLLLIAGPCSVDNVDAALEYGSRLKSLQDEVSAHFYIVMRSYFEKPRTTVGWKGLIYDPDLTNKSCNIEKGLRIARNLMLQLSSSGLPLATEFLDPVIPQYIADLVSWAAIGARTTESQTHRQMASGFSMPTGFKNSTDGSVNVAIDAIRAAAAKHAFLGVIEDGRMGVFQTRGNKNCHIVLRGGSDGPNYGSEYIAFAKELLRKAGLVQSIVVDCSHGNSLKKHELQLKVLEDVVKQVSHGETAISGVMMESYLCSGRQEVVDGVSPKFGQSITDACLGWDETASAVRAACKALSSKK
jgi:3-deoxy-7-phosphoheptulonate synthase